MSVGRRSIVGSRPETFIARSAEYGSDIQGRGVRSTGRMGDMAANIGKNMQVLEGTKRPPSAKALAITIAVGWVVFVGVYLLLWEHAPEWQLVLNRISWSSADFVSLAATALGLYTYYLVQKSNQSTDMLYLQRFVLTLKKAGIEPEELEPVIKQTNGFVSLITQDPETAKRIEKAMFQVLRERYERLAKLDDEEMYEALRSLGK